jgi:hypothetical protein
MDDQEAALRRLSSFLGPVSLCPASRPFLELFDPAGDADLHEFELRFGRSIPTALAQLFRVSNGMLIGETFVRPVQELVTTQQLKWYGAPPQLGCSLFIAEDVINGLSDGYYCMPVEGDKASAVVKVDMYGAVDERDVSVEQFLIAKLSELPLCELAGFQDGR